MIVKITPDFCHTGAEILDLSNTSDYKKVSVSQAPSNLVKAEPNCCIENSRDLADLEMASISGFVTAKATPGVAIFHYWNQDASGTYWDCTPDMASKSDYYILKETSMSDAEFEAHWNWALEQQLKAEQ